MKKISSLLLTAMAISFTVACNKELPEEMPQSAVETVVFTASMEGADSKAVLDQDAKKTMWEAGDKVTIHNGTKGYEFTAKTAGVTTELSYTGSDFSGNKFIAVYPAGNCTADVENKTVITHIPVNQPSVNNSFHESASVAVAYTENNTLAFKHAVSLLKFTVKGNNIKGLIFYGNNGEGISGDVKLTLNKNSNAVMSVVPQETEYTENDVTEAKLITWAKLWANTGDEKNWCFEENVTYYMAVAPQNYSKGFTAQLEVAGVGLVDVRKLTRSKELEPGFIYDLGELSYVVTPKVEKVYLRPGIWAADGAWFSAHFWGAKEEDLKLTEEQNGLFSVSVTEGQTGMKLCRMNPKYDLFSWNNDTEDDHVWTETGDLSIPEAGSDKICYVMTDWNAGDWMTIEEALAYVEEETPPTPENPMTPGENSEWAIIGAFNGWKDQILVAESADVVVAKSLKLKAAEGFLVRKPSTDWDDKYGASGVNYIKANHYVKTSQGGSDLCVEADGTYDIYFNVTTKAIYVMTSGVAYATAKEQTSNGKEPVQEEPEVTDKTIYLKPNANWKVDNARFAAYFFGNGETWVSMTDSDADGIYEVNLPVGFDYGCNVIFCRMNPGTTGNIWNNKWNQTDDLVVPTNGNNLYTVKEGTWDKGGGEWSKK